MGKGILKEVNEKVRELQPRDEMCAPPRQANDAKNVSCCRQVCEVSSAMYYDIHTLYVYIHQWARTCARILHVNRRALLFILCMLMVLCDNETHTETQDHVLFRLTHLM